MADQDFGKLELRVLTMADELGIQIEPGTETGRHKPERKPHEISGPIWTPSEPGEQPPF